MCIVWQYVSQDGNHYLFYGVPSSWIEVFPVFGIYDGLYIAQVHCVICDVYHIWCRALARKKSPSSSN